MQPLGDEWDEDDMDLAADDSDSVASMEAPFELGGDDPRPSEALVPGVELGGGPPLPSIIVTDRRTRDLARDALAAIAARNNPPRLFQRAGLWVRLRVDDSGRLAIEALTLDGLRGELDRSANFFRRNIKGKNKPVPTPLILVRDLMSLARLPLPQLAGIAKAPLYSAAGELRTVPGYDAETRYYFEMEEL